MDISAEKPNTFLFIILIGLFINGKAFTQNRVDSLSGEQKNTLSQKVFVGTTIGVYSLGSIALYKSWYEDFDQSSFHFFNDWNEWGNMDKLGHMQASYLQADLLYNGFIASGISEEKAIAYGVGFSIGFQTTIEIMDGFSSAWGFSWFDYLANIFGAGSFALQQKYWKEQKFKFKLSYWPESHPNNVFASTTNGSFMSLNERSDILFGRPFYQKFLKDYNAQTIWISFNPKEVLKLNKWPSWLNLAVGYSAENLYGGFDNTWSFENEIYSLPTESYTRQHQYILSLDYNLSNIKLKKKAYKTSLKLLDYFKWPAPAVVYNSELGWQFHLVFTN